MKKKNKILVIIKKCVTLLMPKPKSYAERLAGKGKNLYPKDYLEKERQSW